MVEIRMHQVTRALVRCPVCADAAVPDDLPPLPDPIAPFSPAPFPVGAVSAGRRGRYGEDT